MDNSRRFWVVLSVAAGVAILWYRMHVFSDGTIVQKPSVAVIVGGASPYWQLIANGASAASVDLNVDVEVMMPDEDERVELQTKILSQIDRDKYDGVAISPLDADGQTRLINELAKHAPVITVDSDAPLSARSSYVGSSNISAGQMCAQLVKEAIPAGGKVAVFVVNLTKDNMIERKLGFVDELASQDSPPTNSDGESEVEALTKVEYQIVEFLTDGGNAKRNKQLMGELLTTHPDIACVVGMNSKHGPILVKNLKEAGKLGEVKVVAFDEADMTLDGVESGDIYATVVQDPYQYGYESVRFLKKLIGVSEAQRPLTGSSSTLTVNTKAVRRDNLAEFRKQLESRLRRVTPTGS